jgi:hexosaminidase
MGWPLPAVLFLTWCVTLSHSFESPWTFTCDQSAGECVRQLTSDTANLTSQSVWSMTCPPYSVMWPLPSNYSLGGSVTSFNPALVTVESNSNQVLAGRIEAAVWRMIDLLTKKGEEGPLASQVSLAINVEISSYVFVPSIGMDESYALNVTKTEDVVVHIQAETYFGARHAIETLFQLTDWDSYNSAYIVHDSVLIQDEPFYPHRGIMLDTARNFIPVSKIKEVIDSLSYSKMNVFHWHITDTQSFPLTLDSLPDFVKFGAYSPDMVYTKADVTDLISYAADRGVVIIPELDAPPLHMWELAGNL